MALYNGRLTVLFFIFILQIKGAYGKIFKTENRTQNRISVLKSIRMAGKEGMSMDAIRELKALKALNGLPHVVEFYGLEYFSDANGTLHYFLELEFVDHDLCGILNDRRIKLTEIQIKSYMQQLLLGIQSIHQRGFWHLDLKTANILVTKDGLIKITDFGLSRYHADNALQRQYGKYFSSNVVTLWYRAPELISARLRQKNLLVAYNGAHVDMWSFACIFAEFMQRSPLFTGENEQETLNDIQRFFKSGGVNSAFPMFFNYGKESSGHLLEQCLQLEPSLRLSPSEALSHPWFLSNGLPNRFNGQLPSETRNSQWIKHMNAAKDNEPIKRSRQFSEVANAFSVTNPRPSKRHCCH
mmetsp:Transcript_6017/g.8762  ORF Transcript_6017/g.8762 Transcript_6017/m.8762 type:complete len:355 (-) Transcript_6017:318-1382(-)